MKEHPHRHLPIHTTGYDDAQGAYKFVERDHIAFRYEYISALGDGSFGQCVKVRFLYSFLYILSAEPLFVLSTGPLFGPASFETETSIYLFLRIWWGTCGSMCLGIFFKACVC